MSRRKNCVYSITCTYCLPWNMFQNYSYILSCEHCFISSKQVLLKENFLMQHIMKATWYCKWRLQGLLFGAMHHRRQLVKQLWSAWPAVSVLTATKLLLCLVSICMLIYVTEVERINGIFTPLLSTPAFVVVNSYWLLLLQSLKLYVLNEFVTC